MASFLIFAAEFLGYPMVPRQAEFYMSILAVIGASIGMVTIAYVSFWLKDARKNSEVRYEKPVFA